MAAAYFYALFANFFFAFAGIVFTQYSKKISVVWTNAFKCVVALFSFGVAAVLAGALHKGIELRSFWTFLLSGFLGLFLADFFLLRAYARIGSARTLVVWSFQPIYLGVLAYVFFGQGMSWTKVFSIFFMMACIFSLSFEKFRKEGRWEIKGPLYTLVGMMLDGLGILLTRYAFDQDLQLSPWEGNFYRTLGAAAGFFLLNFFMPLHLTRKFFRFGKTARARILLASFFGTFVSLGFFLTAVQTGHLATVSAISGSAPVFAAIIECVSEKKWPSATLIFSFLLFGLGFYLLML